MPDAVVALDPQAWAHVAVALTAWTQRCREQGAEVPGSVRDLLEHALSSAKDRQEPTTRDPLAAMLDALEVPALLLSVGRTARVLDVSPRSVERLIASGALPSVRVGGSRRVRVADVEAYVEGLSDSEVADAS